MTRAVVAKVARATAELVGLDREIGDDAIEIDPRFAGPDYGLPDEATVAAIRMAASLEAMLTEPGLRGEIDGRADRHGQGGGDPEGAKVLNAHFDGAPALNPYHTAFG